jgi:hypothetical protein
MLATVSAGSPKIVVMPGNVRNWHRFAPPYPSSGCWELEVRAFTSKRAAFEEGTNSDAKRLGECIDVVDADVALSCFDLGKIRLHKARCMRKLFLCEGTFPPKTAQIASENHSG